ncbi:GTP cyclohydrolase I FolE2 [Amycolatopsis nigrescens]|uniref:GTP cyclohydrolase I FolE2 n=1 Tax=Amycolatopsis nigrescens TaxID=381445 RepID=UPI0009FC95FC|nr:GTP cyclohydrolase I FolE2 [Amycolatopsis nigrescens]
MHDVQNEFDKRGIEIDQVGIAGLRYPLVFNDGVLHQPAVATASVTVRLQADRRGTHMSRMVALVHEHFQDFDPRQLPQILKAGVHLLDAPGIELSLTFPITTKTTAPASREESCLVHDVTLTAALTERACKVTTSVLSEVTSVCPCSKKISDYGAHNQRSRVTLSVNGSGDDPYPLTLSDAVEIVRNSGSAPVVPLVKRPDERVLTMQGYENPVFVEDMARHISAECRNRNLLHRVQVVNLESIHSHNAVALVVAE